MVAGFAAIFMFLLFFGFLLFMLGAYWRVFEKQAAPAGMPLIPFWNIYQMVKIAGMSGWSMLLLLIPFVNLFYAIGVNMRIARAFGQSSGFGIGMALLSFVFWPILGYGDARYEDKDQNPYDQQEDSSSELVKGHQNDQGEWVEEVPLDEW